MDNSHAPYGQIYSVLYEILPGWIVSITEFTEPIVLNPEQLLRPTA